MRVTFSNILRVGDARKLPLPRTSLSVKTTSTLLGREGVGHEEGCVCIYFAKRVVEHISECVCVRAVRMYAEIRDLVGPASRVLSQHARRCEGARRFVLACVQ